ncbi:hypothetical protein [Arthrobacter sp. R-11]|uniref:hypothetical protein n=1 Tax=Arthrobacter sp. R-11 TaxID=3404053 RepID=UPI003CE957F3
MPPGNSSVEPGGDTAEASMPRQLAFPDGSAAAVGPLSPSVQTATAAIAAAERTYHLRFIVLLLRSWNVWETEREFLPESW